MKPRLSYGRTRPRFHIPKVHTFANPADKQKLSEVQQVHHDGTRHISTYKLREKTPEPISIDSRITSILQGRKLRSILAEIRNQQSRLPNLLEGDSQTQMGYKGVW